MEIGVSKSEKDDQEGKESLKSMDEDEELMNKSTFTPSKAEKHENVLVLNAKKPKDTENCTREPFTRHMQSLDCNVPEHIITLDDKYLGRCLKLVYASAMSGNSSSSVPGSLIFRMSSLSKEANTLHLNSKCSYALNEFVSYFPLEAGIVSNGIMGTVTRSKGGMNLLKCPLVRQLVSAEAGIVGVRACITDATKSAGDTISTIPLMSTSSPMVISESERFTLETENKRHVSVSSTSTVSNHSYFSLFGSLNHGMLRCTWKAGLPHYVFSLDDHNELYTTTIMKSEFPNNNGFDYLYKFHTEAYLVGKMRVSTSFKLCSNNFKIKETNFVLFGEAEIDTGEAQTSISHSPRKSKRLPKKMSEVFKTNDTSRDRASSMCQLTNEQPFIDLPNLELASIIVKDHVCGIHQEPEIGGWGMKFLKKIKSKNTASSIDTLPTPCDYFAGNNVDCSTSMNIIISADFHGGPQNRTGGPSQLVDRWQNGGKCECGGWDIGCPITVLNAERSKDENLSPTVIRVSGTQDSAPVMKMVSTHDGLYDIHFRSRLSPLQSLSIAVSIIHSQIIQ